MYIIKLNAQSNGGRPPLQTWQEETAPDGYALCPEEFHSVFYSTSPAGFVNITVEDGVVTEMTVNQEALDAYVASLPPKAEEEPSEQDDIDAMLVDQEYRITMLELGITA